MTDRYAHLNGSITPLDKAGVGVSDRGLLYGDGLYETIRVRNGRCIRIDLHMRRLSDGAGVLEIGIPTRKHIEDAIAELLDANGLTDARVRVTVTRGVSPDAPSPTIVITAVQLPEHGLDPTRAIISSCRRDETSPLCGVKTLNCLTSVMAGIEAMRAGADDAIISNIAGNVAEATTANVFMVSGARLLTPALNQGCLPGTVRAAVLELAPRMGLEAVEVVISPDDLAAADEVFLTSAIKLARPIVELDGKRVGTGTNECCRQIREALLQDE